MDGRLTGSYRPLEGEFHRPLCSMSESAAKFKLFVLPPLHQLAHVDTLQAAGAEDKPLLGSKLSADSGAKTRLGFSTS